jgi:hypothetical protein
LASKTKHFFKRSILDKDSRLVANVVLSLRVTVPLCVPEQCELHTSVYLLNPSICNQHQNTVKIINANNQRFQNYLEAAKMALLSPKEKAKRNQEVLKRKKEKKNYNPVPTEIQPFSIVSDELRENFKFDISKVGNNVSPENYDSYYPIVDFDSNDLLENEISYMNEFARRFPNDSIFLQMRKLQVASIRMVYNVIILCILIIVC